MADTGTIETSPQLPPQEEPPPVAGAPDLARATPLTDPNETLETRVRTELLTRAGKFFLDVRDPRALLPLMAIHLNETPLAREIQNHVLDYVGRINLSQDPILQKVGNLLWTPDRKGLLTGIQRDIAAIRVEPKTQDGELAAFLKDQNFPPDFIEAFASGQIDNAGAIQEALSHPQAGPELWKKTKLQGSLANPASPISLLPQDMRNEEYLSKLKQTMTSARPLKDDLKRVLNLPNIMIAMMLFQFVSGLFAEEGQGQRRPSG